MTHTKFNADLTIDEEQSWSVAKGEFVPDGSPGKATASRDDPLGSQRRKGAEFRANRVRS